MWCLNQHLSSPNIHVYQAWLNIWWDLLGQDILHTYFTVCQFLDHKQNNKTSNPQLSCRNNFFCSRNFCRDEMWWESKLVIALFSWSSQSFVSQNFYLIVCWNSIKNLLFRCYMVDIMLQFGDRYNGEEERNGSCLHKS
jgi:hypothetical protein